MPDESFDVVLCTSSFFFIPDMAQAVRESWRVLKPGGRFVFSSFGPTFFKPLRMLWRDRLVKHGLSLSPSLPSDRLAEPTTSEMLLRDAGFADIKVQSEQLGYYQTLEQRWHEIKVSIEGIPLAKFSEEEQAQIKEEHLAELRPLLTEQGLWVDVAANFAFGDKP